MSRAPDLDLVACWCGAKGTHDELFDDSGLSETCGGAGELICLCGGDLCVCHNHGSIECPGCEDCEGLDDDCCEEDGDDY
jgi:hypothetical protein